MKSKPLSKCHKCNKNPASIQFETIKLCGACFLSNAHKKSEG